MFSKNKFVLPYREVKRVHFDNLPLRARTLFKAYEGGAEVSLEVTAEDALSSKQSQHHRSTS